MSLHLVLDIDGTLLSEKEDTKEKTIRPFLYEFLHFCFKQFETVNIFTAMSRQNYEKIYLLYFKDFLDQNNYKFSKIFTSKKITNKFINYNYINNNYSFNMCNYPFKTIKRIKKFYTKDKKINKNNILIIDNTPETFSENYGNAIHIKTFYKFNIDDEELKKCILLLEYLSLYYDDMGSIRYIRKSI